MSPRRSLTGTLRGETNLGVMEVLYVLAVVAGVLLALAVTANIVQDPDRDPGSPDSAV